MQQLISVTTELNSPSIFPHLFFFRMNFLFFNSLNMDRLSLCVLACHLASIRHFTLFSTICFSSTPFLFLIPSPPFFSAHLLLPSVCLKFPSRLTERAGSNSYLAKAGGEFALFSNSSEPSRPKSDGVRAFRTPPSSLRLSVYNWLPDECSSVRSEQLNTWNIFLSSQLLHVIVLLFCVLFSRCAHYS